MAANYGNFPSSLRGRSTMSKAGRNFFRVKRPANSEVHTSGHSGSRRSSLSNSAGCQRRNADDAFEMLQLVIHGLVSVVGLGVLVIAGHVANDVAGPAIISSLIIAAVTSLLSGLCYAEFVTRQSESSDSVYSCFYQNIGELPAFVVGWSHVLQHACGMAATGRAFSALLDYISGHRIRDLWSENIDEIPLLKTYPDIVAFFTVVLAALLFGIGLKWTRRLDFFLGGATFGVAILFVAVGAKHIDSRGWASNGFLPDESSGLLSGAAICTCAFSAHYVVGSRVKPIKRPERNVPLAIGVTLTTCFVVYFTIATVFTLMVHRRKLDSNVPFVQAFEMHDIHWARYVMALSKAFGLILTLLSLSHTLYSSVFTLAKDGLLFRCCIGQCRPRNQPILPSLTFGLVSSLMSMFWPLTSLLEIMSLSPLVINMLVCCCVLQQRYKPDSDWFYEPLATVASSSTSTTSPSVPSSVPSSPMSAFSNHQATTPSKTRSPARPHPELPSPAKKPISKFYINKQTIFPLVKQNSLTTESGDEVATRTMASDFPLLSLSLDSDADLVDSDFIPGDSSDTDIDAIVAEYKEKLRVATLTTCMGSRTSFDTGGSHFPTAASGRRVCISVLVLTIAFFFVSLIMVVGGEVLGQGNMAIVAILCLLSTVVVASVVVIVRQPQNPAILPSGHSCYAGVFQVPFAPWIPLIATFLNTCLFASTLHRQWSPFSIWMIVGSGVYFMYGVWNSTAASQTHRKHRTENIKLQPLPKQPFISSVLPIHSQNTKINRRITQVDTILISR